MTDHTLKVNFVVKAGAGIGKRPSYAEQVAAENARLARRVVVEAELAKAEAEGRPAVFGLGRGLAVPHEQLAEGERQAQETVITARLDACSSLDHVETRRGKVSRLDGQGVVGPISPLDRIVSPDFQGPDANVTRG